MIVSQPQNAPHQTPQSHAKLNMTPNAPTYFLGAISFKKTGAAAKLIPTATPVKHLAKIKTQNESINLTEPNKIAEKMPKIEFQNIVEFRPILSDKMAPIGPPNAAPNDKTPVAKAHWKVELSSWPWVFNSIALSQLDSLI